MSPATGSIGEEEEALLELEPQFSPIEDLEEEDIAPPTPVYDPMLRYDFSKSEEEWLQLGVAGQINFDEVPPDLLRSWVVEVARKRHKEARPRASRCGSPK